MHLPTSIAIAGLVVASACVQPKRAASVPHGPAPSFIHDNYVGALAEAQARDVPLFVDAWAPW